MYEERKKELNSTTNASISEEILSGVREILRCTIYIQQKHNQIKTNKREQEPISVRVIDTGSLNEVRFR